MIACDKLQAQLQAPADDVARTDSEHKTVVVAEIVSHAADQLDVRRDQIPRYASGPGPVGVRIAKGPDAPGRLQFAGIHIAGFGVDIEVPCYCREIVAAENLEARAVIQAGNHVLAHPGTEEES